MLKTTGPWDERAARRTSSIERNPWSRSKVTPYLASASCTSALARSTSRLMPEFEPATLTMSSTTPKSWTVRPRMYDKTLLTDTNEHGPSAPSMYLSLDVARMPA